jgi:hypothetical protein
MWKVAVVQPVREGFGFNITTEANLPLVSFAYKTRAEAEAAATHAQAAVEKAVSVLPLFNPQPRRQWWAVLLDWWNR